ncbi:MAG: methionyl-tRNA formyltransferase [Lachnospiraceae bacterium]|nr:methionyl-tRNA formyltransferase [Lachnospiraceae bacterium]
MRLVFMGTPDIAASVLKRLYEEGFDVAAVVTNPDKPKGRSGAPVFSPVKEEAMLHGTKVLQPLKAGDPAFVERLEQLAPDVMVVIAYGHILRQKVLDIPRLGCVNIHTSLLPKYRGAAPINQAIIDGCSETGVTTMLMDAGMDTGDILLQWKVPIEPKETAGSLFEKLAAAGADLIVETLRGMEAGTIEPKKQEGEPSYVHMMTKNDGLVDWTKSAAKIERLIRGLDPWPGAFSFLEGKRVKLLAADVLEEAADADPGTVDGSSKKELVVNTGCGKLRITRLQQEGKKAMDAPDYLRGVHLSDNSRFTDGK